MAFQFQIQCSFTFAGYYLHSPNLSICFVMVGLDFHSCFPSVQNGLVSDDVDRVEMSWIVFSLFNLILEVGMRT